MSIPLSSLLFAYGSNLDAEDLGRFCAEQGLPPVQLRAVGPAYWPDRKPHYGRTSVRLGGGALVPAPSPGGALPGMVFEVLEAQSWEVLDIKEGAPHRYRRVACHVLRDDGAVLEAQSYDVADPAIAAGIAPSPDYAATVLRDLQRWNLPTGDHQLAARGGPVPALERVFAYGTLLTGEPNSPLLDPATAEPARVPGHLHSLGEWPVLTPLQPGEDAWVLGEVRTVQGFSSRLATLDQLEDFVGYGPASMYLRVLVAAQTAHGPQLAWVWRMDAPPAEARRVPSGDWRKR